MGIGLYVLTGVLVTIIICLTLKILLMQKNLKEIECDFKSIIRTDTNSLLNVSSGDKYIRSLANSLNKELYTLRKEHHRYTRGDKELKNAVINISHDLRTPLTAICGYLNLLEREEKNEDVSRYIRIIDGRVQTLKELTDELFRYSVILSAEKENCIDDVVINDVLAQSAADYYAALSERNIVPVINIPDQKVIRQLDRSSLSRIFTNLLGNALKYSDGDLEITLNENGEIIFSNTAASLTEVQVAKLFDRFYTVDNARNSTGLGLSIAKTLTEKMNGSIRAEHVNNKLIITVWFS